MHKRTREWLWGLAGWVTPGYLLPPPPVPLPEPEPEAPKSSRWQWLDVGVHDFTPYVALCTDREMFEEVCDKHKIRTSHEFLSRETARASTHVYEGAEINNRSELLTVVCMHADKEISMPALAGIMAHETVHIIDEAMERIGETKPGYEIKAYLIQRVVYSLVEEYIRQVFGKKYPSGDKS